MILNDDRKAIIYSKISDTKKSGRVRETSKGFSHI